MNPEDLQDYKIVMGTTTLPVSQTAASTVTISSIGTGAASLLSSDYLDRYVMNQLVFEHKVSEHEMLKLKEVKPDFADDIKENIAKNLARDIVKKATFTKKKLPNEDTHHFIGRVYCFTKDELEQLIKDARNA